MGPLSNEITLELRQGTHDAEEEPTIGSGGVDGLG
jgi:hypothetical protein